MASDELNSARLTLGAYLSAQSKWIAAYRPATIERDNARLGARDDSSGCRAWGDPLPCLICFLVFLADSDETAYPKVSQLATVAQVVDVAVRYSPPGGDLGDGEGKLYWRPIRHRCAFSKYAEPKVQVDLLY